MTRVETGRTSVHRNSTRVTTEPGGNLRQVFLFDPERVSFTDRAGGDATTAVGVTKVHGKAQPTPPPGDGRQRVRQDNDQNSDHDPQVLRFKP